MPTRNPFPVDSYDELLKYEPELLERIAAIPNGGQLFLTHPLMLLAEIGAELSPDVQAEFAARHGGAGGWAEAPYRALRESTSQQTCQVRLRGLFRKSTP